MAFFSEPRKMESLLYLSNSLDPSSATEPPTGKKKKKLTDVERRKRKREWSKISDKKRQLAKKAKREAEEAAKTPEEKREEWKRKEQLATAALTAHLNVSTPEPVDSIVDGFPCPVCLLGTSTWPDRKYLRLHIMAMHPDLDHDKEANAALKLNNANLDESAEMLDTTTVALDGVLDSSVEVQVPAPLEPNKTTTEEVVEAPGAPDSPREVQMSAAPMGDAIGDTLEWPAASNGTSDDADGRSMDSSIHKRDYQDMEDSPSQMEGSRREHLSAAKSAASKGDKDESTPSKTSNPTTVVALKFPKKTATPRVHAPLNATAEESVEERKTANGLLDMPDSAVKVQMPMAPVEDTMEYIVELPAITNMTRGNNGNEGLGNFFSKAFDHGGDDAITADFESTKSSVVVTMKFPKKIFTTPVVAAMKLSKKRAAPATETGKPKASKISLSDGGKEMQAACDEEEDDIII